MTFIVRVSAGKGANRAMDVVVGRIARILWRIVREAAVPVRLAWNMDAQAPPLDAPAGAVLSRTTILA